MRSFFKNPIRVMTTFILFMIFAGFCAVTYGIAVKSWVFAFFYLQVFGFLLILVLPFMPKGMETTWGEFPEQLKEGAKVLYGLYCENW